MVQIIIINTVHSYTWPVNYKIIMYVIYKWPKVKQVWLVKKYTDKQQWDGWVTVTWGLVMILALTLGCDGMQPNHTHRDNYISLSCQGQSILPIVSSHKGFQSSSRLLYLLQGWSAFLILDNQSPLKKYFTNYWLKLTNKWWYSIMFYKKYTLRVYFLYKYGLHIQCLKIIHNKILSGKMLHPKLQ